MLKRKDKIKTEEENKAINETVCHIRKMTVLIVLLKGPVAQREIALVQHLHCNGLSSQSVVSVRTSRARAVDTPSRWCCSLKASSQPVKQNRQNKQTTTTTNKQKQNENK